MFQIRVQIADGLVVVLQLPDHRIELPRHDVEFVVSRRLHALRKTAALNAFHGADQIVHPRSHRLGQEGGKQDAGQDRGSR